MTLRFTPRARDDLREIMEYIAKENPAAAVRVGRAIFDATALIAARTLSRNSQCQSPGIAQPLGHAVSVPNPLFRRGR
ncbi:type II toxin-antitoxin system RelE/ParE family toxin [Bradyrhizobium sp. KBS0727]|uniref:type II toxin-antitoxin system RelE/ParE family toxin n=1 Tax=unclassified Bradyrhizobium TaxID=2631580 RepID=UPI00110E8D4F|nr:type II toxin-antitoxin system RelE/ParE family toxin [Bradyrhizobium sp. KBS0725]QDW43670.1 type II toxin-antitoxin system RelE/ParE family toxin [Bradyrhizobium sp. KBS0727]